MKPDITADSETDMKHDDTADNVTGRKKTGITADIATDRHENKQSPSVVVVRAIRV